MGLHQKERSQVAYVWMTSSGDGHRVRGFQVQDEKPEVIYLKLAVHIMIMLM